MPWWEIIGWTGSALVVVSLVVPSVRRFRRLNLAGSLIATVYNIVFGIWPYAAMNAAITLIDAYWLLRLRRAGERRYAVCAVDPRSELVSRFLARHGADIATGFPSLAGRGLDGAALAGSTVYLTLCDDEVVGLFAMVVEDGEGRILVDYVTDRFRDLRPGRTLYADPALAATGARRLVVDPTGVGDPAYFAAMGFERRGELLVRAPGGERAS